MYASTMTSKGQLTVPKEVRNALGISSGDVIEFEQKGSEFIFRKRMGQDGCPVCCGERLLEGDPCFFCGGSGFLDTEISSGVLLSGIMRRSKQIGGTVTSQSLSVDNCLSNEIPNILQVSVTSNRYPCDSLNAASDFIQQKFLEEDYPRDIYDNRYFQSPSEEILVTILDSFKTDEIRDRIHRWFRYDRVHPSIKLISSITHIDGDALSIISILHELMNSRRHIFIVGGDREGRKALLQALHGMIAPQEHVIIRDELRVMDVAERMNQTYIGGGSLPVEAVRKLLITGERRYTLIYPEIQEVTDTLPIAEAFFNGGRLLGSIYCERSQDVADWIIREEVGDPKISASTIACNVLRLDQIQGQSHIAEISEIHSQDGALKAKVIMSFDSSHTDLIRSGKE